jgi:hypothetical protein
MPPHVPRNGATPHVIAAARTKADEQADLFAFVKALHALGMRWRKKWRKRGGGKPCDCKNNAAMQGLHHGRPR